MENRGELIEAAAAYRRAIALKPNFAVAYNGLGTTLKHLGDDTRTTALRRVRSGVAEVPSLFIPPNLGGALLTILLAGARSTVWSIVEMRHRRSHVFTPAAIELVHRLADQGKTASEIADEIGSTAASVRARCCQLKIKLVRGANAGVRETQQGRIQEQKLIIRMQPKAYAALEGQGGLHAEVYR